MIRPYDPADLAALRRACLLTGNSGTDASGLYSSDDLLPDVFVEPHVTLSPETAWVVDTGSGPVDYGYGVDWMLIPQVDEFPAHLHIGLLPEAQGDGWGRALMRHLAGAALAAGVPGIHLGMSHDNLGALAFYQRLGFVELPSDSDALMLGIDPARLL